MADSFIFQKIGTVHNSAKYRFEAPRQGVFHGSDSVIELLPEYGGDAIADLAGFDRIWVIFCFHLNSDKGWKAKVKPPYPHGSVCRSLFATRSPYRVNPIGMSCVKVAGIDRRRIWISETDILDGTPVLDIKPYIPAADAFPESAAGWRDDLSEAEWEIIPEKSFVEQSALIKEISGLDLAHFCQVQLSHAPLDKERKRLADDKDGRVTLGCRTWRIVFSCEHEKKRIFLHGIRSNYTSEELLPDAGDKYQDKEFHRKFSAVFGADWEKTGKKSC